MKTIDRWFTIDEILSACRWGILVVLLVVYGWSLSHRQNIETERTKCEKVQPKG